MNPHIYYDGIITSLQSSGGISVYFDELLKRSNPNDYTWLGKPLHKQPNNLETNPARMLERYRDFIFPSNICIETNEQPNSVFHSSYYRLTKASIPQVTTVHDFTYERYVKGIPKTVHSWQKNKAIKTSDIVICVSNNTANDLQTYSPISASKIRVVYNGAADSFKPLTDVEPGSGEASFALFVGSRQRYKNFTQAVLSVAKVKDLSLMIAGGGHLTESELAFLNHHLPTRYLYKGFVSELDLNELYNQAHCLLYPSSYEGFGIPILEAMQAGCPVIAINASSIPEVAGSAALLLNEANVNAIAEALTILTKSQERNKYIQLGFKQAEKFSWQRCFEQTQKIYQELT
ncbi:glycosyltransferase family 1 protein [Thalassotalea psychrophila]|uniref:Glycosyltransferase family 1 protein n=1 Tax=Thalassotalea psychrophila TaxID=3065647 RepID=A0ABY9TR68_9GAMM|nr:glycosyltransferase family 1 protein [Colwelliaceae bacterium SQ149]